MEGKMAELLPFQQRNTTPTEVGRPKNLQSGSKRSFSPRNGEK